MTPMALPPLLMVSEPGSFAEHTIVQRKPQIIADIIAHNAYPPEIVAGLRAFEREIASQVIAPLSEEAEDVAFWRDAWMPWQGKKWRELGWFFAETYFYRRILEIVRYFQPGPWLGCDPFRPQKQAAIAQGLKVLAQYAPIEDAPLEQQACVWLHRSLWGNRADLSNLALRDLGHAQFESDAWRLLIDQTAQIVNLLINQRVRHLHWVADNSGLELLADLGCIDFLLSHGLVETIRLHLKGQPYFVSDAMITDLEATLDALEGADSILLRTMGRRLHAARAEGRLMAEDHPFWATCLSLWSMPADLRAMLAQADLIVLKGDVNYRRLLDDRHWPPTTDLAEVAAFMPASFAALRTLKGELIAGLPEGLAEALAREDPLWLINGERAVIHYVPR